MKKAKQKKPIKVPEEFDKAMRGISGTPKSEVDEAEEKEQSKKEKNGK